MRLRGTPLRAQKMATFVGLGSGQRVTNDLTDPVREPPLKADIDSQDGKNRYRYRGNKRQQRKNARQAEMQARARRFGPPSCDQARDLTQHQCCDNQNVNQISQQN